jgi:hypothetical protein
MPYKSEKQKHLMQAVAHNPEFASKVGIPQSVGQKFEAHKSEPMAKSKARSRALRRK